ncbi:MAG: DEAD/DEAH box helicase [Flavipsychrobacter sp.]|nr:DEAD/DEAH box helicase [Flavipsychrobacter sp.]
MRFEQYHISEDIKESLAELGFKRPTDIQYKAIPSILKGEDVLAIAQTGTGKTAAFAIPILHLLQREQERRRKPKHLLQCLVMVPTRELAIQIAGVFQQIGQFTELNTLALVGGVDQEQQIRALKKGVDIVVATPGRLFDLHHQRVLDLQYVWLLVLDEADHMLDLGFNKDIVDIKKRLPKKHQTLFFSATIDARIKDLAYAMVHNPIRIQVSPQNPVSKNIDHAVTYIAMDDKRFFLERLVKELTGQKILVFARTKVRAERIQAAMKRVGIESLVMHGGKEQDDRLQVMDQFREGSIPILITTDVNARGIDIPDVDYVVNYDLPEEPDKYVHRVGRTGRGMKKGQAISFCSEEEKPLLAAIEIYTGNKIKERIIGSAEYRETVALSEDLPNENWKELLKQAEQEASKKKRKKK